MKKATIELGCGVTAGALDKFVRASVAAGIDIHALSYRKNGQTAVRLSLPPYSTDTRTQLYSLSKSFTSVAFGIAADEGLISEDEKVLDVFPEKDGPSLDPRAREMKFRDLLSMQSGHGVCALADMLNGDPVDNFLHAPFLYRPGTTFVYSTGATCVCAAAVEKRTGKKLVDFLDERLFSPLGIAKPFWKSIGGVTLGGVGLYLSLDDIVPFADMLLAGGTYGGRRIVSEEWLKKATRAHSVDRNNGSHDWVAGYGYQFWMNDGIKGFRGDGAYGQLCIVVPERGITFVMLAEAANMQKEMDLITEFVNNDDAPGSADLSALADIYSPTATESSSFERSYKCDDNAAGITALSLSCDGNELVITKTDANGTESIRAGNGYYAYSDYLITGLYPCISQLEHYEPYERVRTAAFYETDGESVKVTLRHLDTPHTEYWTMKCADTLEWSFSSRTGTFAPRFLPITGR